jgi:pyrimidine deaminase RibD-like protein
MALSSDYAVFYKLLRFPRSLSWRSDHRRQFDGNRYREHTASHYVRNRYHQWTSHEKREPIQGESLVDIFLTDEGAERILTPQDNQYCEMAVALARRSIAENDGEPHPHVGAVVVKDGQILSTGYRGETGEGRHAEYCALKKINNDVDNVDLSGCTVYTTLEPCSIRKQGKTPCTKRLINAKVARVVYGLADKDETVFGHSSLTEAGIDIGVFPKDLAQELQTLNKDWLDTRRKPEVMPPPNRIGYLADASYNKPGTPMTDNIHLVVRAAKRSGWFLYGGG